MVNVDVDPEIYHQLKEYVEANRLEYPSIRYFVQKVLMERLHKINSSEKLVIAER